jgi:hypothetical protein
MQLRFRLPLLAKHLLFIAKETGNEKKKKKKNEKKKLVA